MIIKNQHNLSLYKDRNSHMQKSGVTKKSSSYNNLKETPFKRESSDISFKGVFSINRLKKSFELYNKNTYSLNKNLDFLESFIGKAPKELNKITDEWQEIAKPLSKSKDGSKITIVEKNWTRLLGEGIFYPVTELPLHIIEYFKKLVPKSKASAAKNAANQTSNSWFAKKMRILNNTDIVNSFNGYMETAEKFKYDTKDVQAAGLLSRAMKMFDPKSGNYNGVHERALTRIVTGFIPAFFLANDAYNLSRLCDDDAKAADKEKKTRFNQETKRVVSNAYLQLITLGALSKWINSSKLAFVTVTALSVLLTESFSRLSNGKKLHFISKEEAQKINKAAGKNFPQKEVKPENNTESENKSKPGFKGSAVFNGFGLAADMPLSIAAPTNATVNMTGSKEDKLKEQKELKPLLTGSSIAKWFVGMIAAGFAVRYAKKNIKINDIKLEKYFKAISKKYDNFYDKYTKTKFEFKREEYNKVIAKLKEYDATLAQRFEAVINKNQQADFISKNADDIARILDEANLKDFAEQFRHIKNNKLNDSINANEMKLFEASEAYFKNRKESKIQENLKDLFAKMEDNDFKEEVKMLKELLYDEKGKFSTNNYSKAKDFLEKLAKKTKNEGIDAQKAELVERARELHNFAFSFENRFKVDKNAENIKLFNDAVSALKAVNPKDAEKLEQGIKDALNAEIISLGKRNKQGIREIADFVTEPFKFIWGTITLPFKHIAKPAYELIKGQNKLPEWEKELDAVANGIYKITQKPVWCNDKRKIDLSAEDFAKFMNKRINKSFNTATMSSISNSDLSALAKNTSTAATAWFLMADNHNMVMLKSNGEDKNEAVLKAKERAIQETSRTFYNVMFINLFNNTFRNLYNSSLFGAQTVNTMSTLIGEYVNRKAIGVPVGEHSRSEIINKDYENLNSKGIKGSFFRFMSRLTGKKALSQREQTKKPATEEPAKN